MPGIFIFNGGDPGEWQDCSNWIVEPSEYVVMNARHFLPIDGSVVPKEFTLQFDAYFCAHYYWGAYFEIEVLVNDEVVYLSDEFFCRGCARREEIPISVTGLDVGSPLDIRIVLRSDDSNSEPSYELTYIIDDTPVQDLSFSRIKSMY